MKDISLSVQHKKYTLCQICNKKLVRGRHIKSPICTKCLRNKYKEAYVVKKKKRKEKHKEFRGVWGYLISKD